MRIRWLFLVILLHCFGAAGAEVIIEPQMTTLSPTMKHLRDTCAADGLYDACTRFVAYRLRASCAPEGDLWRISSSATFRPWVFLRNMHSLAHEQEHVRDIRASLEGHLHALEAVAYSSETACEQRVFAEVGGFAATMRELARRSNAERHPQMRY